MHLKNFFFLLIKKLETNNINSYQNVLHDFLLGLRYWRIWYILGTKEIKLRYKRSKFGQLWHVLSTSLQITFMGLIWSYLFKIPVKEFFPYLAVGKIFFEYLSLAVTGGMTFYYKERSFLLGARLPKSIFAYASSTYSLITFLHNFLVLVAVVIIFQIHINWNILFIIPGITLIFINSIWITILFGYLGTRFRDIPPLITSVMSMLMMITPVFWKVEMLPLYIQKYMILNPFYVFIKINRDAIFGYSPDYLYWGVAFLITALGYIITFFMLKRIMNRISFWV